MFHLHSSFAWVGPPAVHTYLERATAQGKTTDSRIAVGGRERIHFTQVAKEVAKERHTRPDGLTVVAQAKVISHAKGAIRTHPQKAWVLLNALCFVTRRVLALTLFEK
jgi:hypothetical protein